MLPPVYVIIYNELRNIFSNFFCIIYFFFCIIFNFFLWYLYNRYGLVDGVYSHFQQYFTYIVAVSFIGGGNRSTRRKPLTCPKLLVNGFLRVILFPPPKVYCVKFRIDCDVWYVKNNSLLCLIIFASQGLRFGSPFSPPLADLEYILKFARNATWWFIEVAPLR